MPISGPDILLYEKKDKIVTMTINRPERLNAMSVELRERLEKSWKDFRDDEEGVENNRAVSPGGRLPIPGKLSPGDILQILSPVVPIELFDVGSGVFGDTRSA